MGIKGSPSSNCQLLPTTPPMALYSVQPVGRPNALLWPVMLPHFRLHSESWSLPAIGRSSCSLSPLSFVKTNQPNQSFSRQPSFKWIVRGRCLCINCDAWLTTGRNAPLAVFSASFSFTMLGNCLSFLFINQKMKVDLCWLPGRVFIIFSIRRNVWWTSFV